MTIPRRTIHQPGDEQSITEKKYRNALQERFQALGAGASAEKLAPLEAKIAALRAKLEAPKRTRAPSSQPSETAILRDVINALKRHPKVARVWRQNSGMAKKQYGDKTHYVRFNTAKGMSDIMGILKDGRTLACEVKSATGKVMPHQQEFLDSISSAGGVAFVARGVDDVIKALR